MTEHDLPDRFFDAVTASGAELPVVRRELQHHAIWLLPLESIRSANLLRKALTQTAMILQRTDSYLGENHRRLKSRVGPAIAKVAIARKLATIIYHILKMTSAPFVSMPRMGE